MIKKLLQVFSFIFNASAFISLSTAVVYIIWQYFGNDYIFGKIVGGDYFNALTYLTFFSRFLPNPITGWLPFWNQGMPAVGGYPTLPFYLISIFRGSLDLVTAMNYFSVIALMLFFVFSLLMFWQVSKNWFIATLLTGVLWATRATYYQLTTGGFIASASAQWYLPLILFLIYRFSENFKARYLILASIISGISLLHQAPTTLLMIFTPSILVLFALSKLKKSFRISFFYSAVFLVMSFGIGALGLYTVYLQTFLGSGTGSCYSPQCWGIYPKHLIVWLNIIPILIISYILPVLIAVMVFKKKLDLFFLPALAGLLFFIIYALLAYFQLIDSLSNIIFPTRIFWAGLIFALLLAASLFHSLQKLAPLFAIPYSVILLLVFGFYYIFQNTTPLGVDEWKKFYREAVTVKSITALAVGIYIYQNPPNIHKDFPATVPINIESYIIPKFQTGNLKEIVPEWILSASTNWRLDSFNSGIYHWFSTISDIPTTRGYSNHPLGAQRDWLYYLQVSTRNTDPGFDQELVKNRALFLLDHYGIKFIENSVASYPNSLLSDPKIIAANQNLREGLWYQVNEGAASPVVSATRSPGVLFVGDDRGYLNFVKTLSMTNLNSRFLVPVKGPQSLDEVSKKDLDSFQTLVLYRFTGSNLDKFLEFVKKGGRVFIETGSLDNPIKNKNSEILPINNLIRQKVSPNGLWNQDKDSLLVKEINSQNFAKLSFKEKPWVVSTTENGQKQWAKKVLDYENKPIVSEGSVGKGRVVWSGVNLLFHIIDKDNFEEAKLFKNIILSLIDVEENPIPEAAVERKRPEVIKVTGEDIKGVYFKENYHPGWKAYIDGKQTKVYRAGLDFMYVPVPGNQVELRFQGGFINWLLAGTTMVFTLTAVLFLIYPGLLKLLRKPVFILYNFIVKQVKERLSKKWNED